jgi:hypothetical protein
VRNLAAVLVLLSALAVRADAPPVRVLFIGNSLTYANDLPAMVRRIADVDGRKVVTETIALPNHSLEDHLGTPRLDAALAKQWDFVVLQQGPSSLDESRRQLIRDTKAVAKVVRPPARIALLMVWPSRDRWSVLGRVADSYRLAAEAVGGTWIPAGNALCRRRSPAMRVWSCSAATAFIRAWPAPTWPRSRPIAR